MVSNISNNTNKKNYNMCFILVYKKLNGDTYLGLLPIEANRNRNPSHYFTQLSISLYKFLLGSKRTGNYHMLSQNPNAHALPSLSFCCIIDCFSCFLHAERWGKW